MVTRTKRRLIGGLAVNFLGCTIAVWIVIKIVAWARDLLNRIVADIGGDAFATAFGGAVVDSYQGALRDGDSALQLQVINNQFPLAIAENPDNTTRIRVEYRRQQLISKSKRDEALVQNHVLRQRFRHLVAVLACISLLSSNCVAQDPVVKVNSTAGLAQISLEQVRTVLKEHCLDCHGPRDAEANVRLDGLAANPLSEDDEPLASRMLGVLTTGEMPPDGEMPSNSRASLTSWLQRELQRLHSGRTPAERNRRFTNAEYNRTLQQLFRVQADFTYGLPPDPLSTAGYSNSAELLGLSTLRIEAYLDAARRAVTRYVAIEREASEPIRYHIEFEHLYYSTAERYKSLGQAPVPLEPVAYRKAQERNAANPPTYVDPLSARLPGAYSDDEMLRAAIPKLHQQYVALPARLAVGDLIVRVRAAGTLDRDGRPPRMRVEAGVSLGDGCSLNKRSMGEVDVAAQPSDPTLIEFKMRLEDIPSKGPLEPDQAFDRLSVFDMDHLYISNISCDEQAVFDKGRGAYADPASGSQAIAASLQQMRQSGVNMLHLDCLEIEMIPGPAGQPNYPWTLPVPTGPGGEWSRQTLQIWLTKFMTQAFRRPVLPAETALKLQLYEELRQQGLPPLDAIRETLAAILISPSFLFLEPQPPSEEAGTQIQAYPLASRLSYAVWNAPPDERLLEHAEDGSLLQPQTYESQVDRLLDHPNSSRFWRSFCRHWLRLGKQPQIVVERQRYPNYDSDLGHLAVEETLQFFCRVASAPLPATTLLDADFAVWNDRLAKHYVDVGVRISSGDFQEVALPPGSLRGGLLTQVGPLLINSDGAQSHPIRRGVWLLDRILNDPPPPPPPNVPDLNEQDPDFRGLSLSEQLQLHRSPGSCSSCHRKIDPWGMTLEGFDALGQWQPKSAHSDNSTANESDANVVLPSGTSINSVAELKDHLTTSLRSRFTASLVHHMMTYLLGREPGHADREALLAIEQRFEEADFQLRELAKAALCSPLFRQ